MCLQYINQRQLEAYTSVCQQFVAINVCFVGQSRYCIGCRGSFVALSFTFEALSLIDVQCTPVGDVCQKWWHSVRAP